MAATAYGRAGQRMELEAPDLTAPSGTARRLRYWLNTFRGFAAFDVRGIDDRVRP